MPNKSSPHGGTICVGSVCSGTLRAQDLLRAFADEYERVLPFNGRALAIKARDAAIAIDADDDNITPDEDFVLLDLIDALDEIAMREGLIFGAHEGDGADFGYWEIN